MLVGVETQPRAADGFPSCSPYAIAFDRLLAAALSLDDSVRLVEQAAGEL